jgi:hypothetical protein
MSNSAAQLYEGDFVRWTEEQSLALREAGRSATNLSLDWENLAEEIESLGRSHRHELRSRIVVILEHLLKLEYSSAQDPRRGWIDTVARERSIIELLLEDSPSLQGAVSGMITSETKRSIRNTIRALIRHGEGSPEEIANLTEARFTEEQVLGEWFPGDAAPGPGTLPASGESEEPG